MHPCATSQRPATTPTSPCTSHNNNSLASSYARGTARAPRHKLTQLMEVPTTGTRASAQMYSPGGYGRLPGAHGTQSQALGYPPDSCSRCLKFEISGGLREHCSTSNTSTARHQYTEHGAPMPCAHYSTIQQSPLLVFFCAIRQLDRLTCNSVFSIASNCLCEMRWRETRMQSHHSKSQNPQEMYADWSRPIVGALCLDVFQQCHDPGPGVQKCKRGACIHTPTRPTRPLGKCRPATDELRRMHSVGRE